MLSSSSIPIGSMSWRCSYYILVIIDDNPLFRRSFYYLSASKTFISHTYIIIYHDIRWQRCSGRVPFIWVPPRHHRRRAAVCTGHAGKKDFRKRLIYFKIIQDNPGNHSKHDNYNGIYLNQSWCSLYKGVGSGHSGRGISNTTTFYLGRFQLHRLCGRLQVGRPHQTGFTIV